MATKSKKEKAPEVRTIPPQPLREEDVQNADMPPVYCNNFQIRGGEQDVWLCFNEVNPVSYKTASGVPPIVRRSTVVVSLAQFFAIAEMMDAQARALQERFARAAIEAQKTGE
jgi:hypothetical protein